jgi:hypothetical protein
VHFWCVFRVEAPERSSNKITGVCSASEPTAAFGMLLDVFERPTRATVVDKIGPPSLSSFPRDYPAKTLMARSCYRRYRTHDISLGYASTLKLNHFHPARRHFCIGRTTAKTGFRPETIPYYLAKNRTSAHDPACRRSNSDRLHSVQTR